MKAIELHTNRQLTIPGDASRTITSRINLYNGWMQANDRHALTDVDLAAYRDHLLERMTPRSAAAHLGTIRGQYKKMITDNKTRDLLYEHAASQTDDIVERKAIVDEILQRLTNATDPMNSSVEIPTVQDVEDSEHVRLTRSQAESLLMAPGVDKLIGLRDTAILAVMLCTGIRAAELSALNVDDLRQSYGGELALRVRHGKGDKKRLVPYGDMVWCLAIVDRWMQRAGITAGAVFRGLYRGGRTLRPNRLKVRQIENIVGSYPVMIDGKMQRLAAHDLRRSYAKLLYNGDTDRLAIRDNLGHASVATTDGYIGKMNADDRRPAAVITFDLKLLNGA